ncbi:MAG TPA: helix-turn-helix transcriptional regulator [Rhodanobacteraceae bacterium]
MKLSPLTIRRLRTERGWSQEQLAAASGLGLRTIQRVEAEGIAAMSTAVSLAATYDVRLLKLQEDPPTTAPRKPLFGHAPLFLGLAILTLAILDELGRIPSQPLSDVLMSANVLTALVGTVLLLPAGLRIVRQRQYIAAALAVLGTPLATLLAAGAIYSFANGSIPAGPLLGMGTAGIALVVMAAREFRHADRTIPG